MNLQARRLHAGLVRVSLTASLVGPSLPVIVRILRVLFGGAQLRMSFLNLLRGASRFVSHDHDCLHWRGPTDSGRTVKLSWVSSCGISPASGKAVARPLPNAVRSERFRSEAHSSS